MERDGGWPTAATVRIPTRHSNPREIPSTRDNPPVKSPRPATSPVKSLRALDKAREIPRAPTPPVKSPRPPVKFPRAPTPREDPIDSSFTARACVMARPTRAASRRAPRSMPVDVGGGRLPRPRFLGVSLGDMPRTSAATRARRGTTAASPPESRGAIGAGASRATSPLAARRTPPRRRRGLPRRRTPAACQRSRCTRPVRGRWDLSLNQNEFDLDS